MANYDLTQTGPEVQDILDKSGLLPENPNTVIADKVDKAIGVTWAELKALRDGGGLKAGQMYRITDYVTTTAQADTRSAGHQFDVLVLALNASVINETAWAIQHEGDTYFAGAKLEAWKLKYCLENDVERFAWADAVNGKGVIYEMEDEWGNKCPYDFKNIMFKRCYCEPEEFEGEGRYLAIPGMETGPDSETLPGQDDEDFIYVYTFSCLASLDEDPTDKPAQADASMGLFVTENEMQADYGDSPRPTNNVMEPYFVSQSIDDGPLVKVRALPNITFQQIYTDEYSCHCSDNHIGGQCHDWSGRSKNFYGNDFGEAKVEYCYFSGYVENCTFSGEAWHSTFSGNIYYNTFSGDTWYSTFSGGLVRNTFSGDAWYITFSGDVENCTFSGYIYYNTFSGNIYYNTFSGDVGYCTFSGYIYYNTFSGTLRECTFSGNVYYSLFKGYSEYVDFVYTWQMQHVTVCGEIKGTDDNHKKADVTGDAKHEQIVTADEQGNVVVTSPWI